mmetsp:Transcript_58032/g.114205  ORF Transcript_58032/g.114205 Transcript_58032/m.114205 type:complete len:361 (+) Transcript_58032:266-1348(+)
MLPHGTSRIFLCQQRSYLRGVAAKHRSTASAWPYSRSGTASRTEDQRLRSAPNALRVFLMLPPPSFKTDKATAPSLLFLRAFVRKPLAHVHLVGTVAGQKAPVVVGAGHHAVGRRQERRDARVLGCVVLVLLHHQHVHRDLLKVKVEQNGFLATLHIQAKEVEVGDAVAPQGLRQRLTRDSSRCLAVHVPRPLEGARHVRLHAVRGRVVVLRKRELHVRLRGCARGQVLQHRVGPAVSLGVLLERGEVLRARLQKKSLPAEALLRVKGVGEGDAVEGAHLQKGQARAEGHRVARQEGVLEEEMVQEVDVLFHLAAGAHQYLRIGAAGRAHQLSASKVRQHPLKQWAIPRGFSGELAPDTR